MAIEDTDPGFRKLLKKFNDMNEFTVAVGLFPEAGYEPGTEITTAQVGAVHEFGSKDGRIPQRSFIRGTVTEMTDEILAMQADHLSYVLAGTITYENALKRIGLTVKQRIQARIREGIDPANKDTTIARKRGKSTPLIDTGHMLNSITYKVRMRRENESEGSLSV